MNEDEIKAEVDRVVAGQRAWQVREDRKRRLQTAFHPTFEPKPDPKFVRVTVAGYWPDFPSTGERSKWS